MWSSQRATDMFARLVAADTTSARSHAPPMGRVGGMLRAAGAPVAGV